VVLEKGNSAHPRSFNDGVTIAKEQSKLEDFTSRNTAWPYPSGRSKTKRDAAGDAPPPPPFPGAHAMVKGGSAQVAAGANAITLKKGIARLRLPRQEDRGACQADSPIPTPSPRLGTISAGNDEKSAG